MMLRVVKYLWVMTVIVVSLSSGPVQAAWQVNLEVGIPDPAADTGTALNKLSLGAGSGTSDAFDNQWDTVALSSASMNAHFHHPEYPLEKAILWRDLRSEAMPKAWALEVASPLERQARLTWDAKAIPANIALKLIDEQTGNAVNMKGSLEYTYTNSPSVTRRFTIQASEISSSGVTTPPPAQTNGSLGAGGGGGGGGCGYIRGVDGGKDSSRNEGSIAFNMAILFTPLFWLAIRRLVFFNSGAYIGGQWEGSSSRHDKKIHSLCRVPVSSDPVVGVHRMRRGRRNSECGD